MQRCLPGPVHMCVGHRFVLHDLADHSLTHVQSRSRGVAPLCLHTSAGSHWACVACLKHNDVTPRGLVHMCVCCRLLHLNRDTHTVVRAVRGQCLHNNLQRSAHIVLSTLHATCTRVHMSGVHSWCISIMHQSQSQWCRQIASYRPLSQKFTTV